MIHGACGPVCLKDGRCTKRFPKKSVNETISNEDEYPTYKRGFPEMGGTVAMIKVNGENIEDNLWVVPYCPVANVLLSYKC